VACFFNETQQNATNLNISVSQGSVAIFFRCGRWCYTLFCYKFYRWNNSENRL